VSTCVCARVASLPVACDDDFSHHSDTAEYDADTYASESKRVGGEPMCNK